MFRLEIFVDDKKLGYVLWALSGHVLEIKTPQPVANAQAKNGKVRASTSGDRVEMFLQFLKDRKVGEFGPGTVREFCNNSGLSERSYSAVLTAALTRKLITRRRPKGTKAGTGTAYVYSIVKGA